MVTTESTGEHVVAGCGELQVEICLNDLETEFAKCELKRSDPVVTYKETVQEESDRTCLSKSKNKLNRIFMKCEPIGEELSVAIDSDELTSRDDPKARQKTL